MIDPTIHEPAAEPQGEKCSNPECYDGRIPIQVGDGDIDFTKCERCDGTGTEPLSDEADQYVLQNGFSGDTMYFWRKNGAGYTSDLSEAEVFTREKALKQNQCREEDIPWPLTYLKQKARQTVNVQHVDYNEAAHLARKGGSHD